MISHFTQLGSDALRTSEDTVSAISQLTVDKAESQQKLYEAEKRMHSLESEIEN